MAHATNQLYKFMVKSLGELTDGAKDRLIPVYLQDFRFTEVLTLKPLTTKSRVLTTLRKKLVKTL